jgi:hypothetical protein
MENVLLEFTGNSEGAQIFRHPITKRQVRAGRNPMVRYVSVEPEEVSYYMSLGLFRLAHRGGVATPVVTRKDSPMRIEPIVDDQPSNSAPSGDFLSEENSETVVSFANEAVADLGIGWMDEEPVAPIEVIEENVNESVETTIEDTSTSEVVVDSNAKIARGRPRK